MSSKEELLGKPETYHNQFSKARAHLDQFVEVDVKKAAAAQLSSEADKLCETVLQLHQSQHQSKEEKEAQKSAFCYRLSGQLLISRNAAIQKPLLRK